MTGKILKIFIWQWGRFGSGPRYACELAMALRRHTDCRVLLSLSKQSELYRGLRQRSMVDFPVSTYANGWDFVRKTLLLSRLRQRLRQYLELHRPDVAICAMPGFWDAAIAGVFNRLNIPLCTIVHDATAHPGDWFRPLYRIQRQLMGRSTGIITLTRHVAEQLHARGLLAGKRHAIVEHIPFTFDDLGIPPPKKPEYPARRPLRLLLAGRLHAYKGVGVLADALPMLDPRTTSVRVVGAGRSADLPRLAALPNVEMRQGWCSERELVSHMDWADVIVAPYVEASQSGIVAVAQGRGRPVIVTPVGGLPEQVLHEKTGLVAKAPTPEAVAGAIGRFLDRPELYEECARHLFPEAHSGERMVRILSQLVQFLQTLPPGAALVDGHSWLRP